MYATPDQLRTRYLTGEDEVDEFALRTDDDLTQALTAATAEIDSYRPAGALSDAALAILADKCLILARLLINQDQALDDAHPIVRDAKQVRHWLDLVARQIVRLPRDDTATISAAIAAPTRTMTYGADFVAGYVP